MATEDAKERRMHHEEVVPKAGSGMAALLLNIAAMLVALAAFIVGIVLTETEGASVLPGVILCVVGGLYAFIIGPILFGGLKILKPNEALVLTLFGKYYGTLKGEGFFFVNPFVAAVNPGAEPAMHAAAAAEHPAAAKNAARAAMSKKLSLKAMTLTNEKQKINDQMGNPIIIGIVVIWRIVNTAKAVFNVDNYREFLSTQCDSALRNTVRRYPYDVSGDDNEKTLRGSSQEIADRIKEEIQQKVEIAGLEIQEARITHLSYAPEIAAAMLQRQQASAIIDARQMIVEGAVGMVEMALSRLSEKEVVQLDEERKAAMVSNLLVVLCANKDAQPVVNSGSIY